MPWAAEWRAKSVADLGPVPVLLLQSAFDFSTTSVCAIRLSLRTHLRTLKFAHFFLNFFFFTSLDVLYTGEYIFYYLKASIPRIGIFVTVGQLFIYPSVRVLLKSTHGISRTSRFFFNICNLMRSIISTFFPGIVVRCDQHIFPLHTLCVTPHFFHSLIFFCIMLLRTSYFLMRLVCTVS